MTFARLKETFLRLPKQTKFIGLGSLILGISTFLPWYADLDSYKIGDQFLGITGPASIVGIVILLLSGFSFWIFSYHLFERKVPRLPVREGILNLFVAIESLFLLVLVNFIYFHPKFGVNITLKESRFGMAGAFIGAIVLLIGGYIQNKTEIAKENEEGRLEPLIKIEPKQAPAPVPQQTQSYQQRQHTPIAPHAEPQRRFFPHAKESTRGFLFGEAPSHSGTSHVANSPAQPLQQPVQPKIEEKGDKSDQSGSYMIRMDL